MKKTRFIMAFVLILAVMCISAMGADFEKSRSYQNNFTDVAENAWYAKSVASVYETSLMEGVSQDTFDTESEMSVAQAITIAARLHSIYNDIEIPEVEGGRWFQKYVEYCLSNGIMEEEQFDSYSRSAFSFEMVQLFAKALPSEYYPALNNIENVHDIPKGLIFHDDVLMFYNAGILNGNDKNGTFLPMSAITRKRAAVIISRVALSENRLQFTLEDVNDNLSVDEFSELMQRHTIKDTLDGIVLAEYEDVDITAALYRYFSLLHNGEKEGIEGEMKQYAAVLKLAKETNLSIPRSAYESCLVSYYVNRASTYSGGLTYFDALDAQRFTDACFVDLSNASMFMKLIPEYYCNSITDDEIYNYVLENDYVYAKHILIAKETEDAYRLALELRLAINDGSDFDELLEKHGEDPGMKSREGGYFFTTGMMVEPFEKAAFALEEGQVSNIVESDFGYHIIKRLSFTKEELLASPDMQTIASHAGSQKFYDTLNSTSETVTFEYVENFEGLSELLK
ncbi:MAG: peptidylprolyl isomerase [Clostridia bacterium]|nr:peptidylprolyl isomerase [Clostridia bacterium]